MKRTAHLVVATFCLSFLLSAAPALSQQQSTVRMEDNFFEPKTITVKVGDSITFDNVGKAPHTATAKDKSWDTGNVNTGEKKPNTFSRAGTFDYVSVYHEALGMVGTITVEEDPQAVSAPSPADEVVQPKADYLVAGKVKQPSSRGHLGPLIFAAIGILGGLALAGLSLARSGRATK